MNSGGFIGYANDIYDIITSTPVKDDEDDQLFYTKIFLNKPTRVINNSSFYSPNYFVLRFYINKFKEKHQIKLDKRSEIFLNLNGALEDIVISVDDSEIYVFNNVTKTKPAVVHGNGPSKVNLFI